MPVVGKAVARGKAVVERLIVEQRAIHVGTDAERLIADELIDAAFEFTRHVVAAGRHVAEEHGPLKKARIANVREACFGKCQRRHVAVFQEQSRGYLPVINKIVAMKRYLDDLVAADLRRKMILLTGPRQVCARVVCSLSPRRPGLTL